MAEEVKVVNRRGVKELIFKHSPCSFRSINFLLVSKESGISELSCEHIYQFAVNKHGQLILENPLTCFGFLV